MISLTETVNVWRQSIVNFKEYIRFLGLLILVSTPSAVAEQLTFVTEEQAPMNFMDPETGKVTGISTRLVRAMLQKADMSAEFRLMPWRRAFRLALTAPDTCLYTTVRSPEREARFQWVGPLFNSRWAFFQRKGGALEVNSLEDLRGKVVSLTTGTRQFVPLDDLDGVQVLEVASDRKAISLLHEGRADLWVSGVFIAGANAEGAGMSVPELVFLWHPMELSVACSPATSKAVIAKLNAALHDLSDLRQKLKQEYYYTVSGDK